MALTVIAAYDISQDNRRARVAARMQEYGDRVQKSVFILRVTAEELALLAATCESTMDLDTDSLWFWRQCETCTPQALVVGQAHTPSPAVCWIIM